MNDKPKGLLANVWRLWGDSHHIVITNRPQDQPPVGTNVAPLNGPPTRRQIETLEKYGCTVEVREEPAE